MKGPLDLVFPNRIGGIQMHANILKRRFRPLCQQVGVTLRWHDMRHYAVSLWIEQGFSIKEVMTFAGHSSVQMTMERYGHLFPTPVISGHGSGRGEIVGVGARSRRSQGPDLTSRFRGRSRHARICR
jgi:hypothetical protein